MLIAARRGVRDVPLLLCVGLAASGATAMLAFWAFWTDPRLGRAVAFVLVIGSVLGVALCRPHRLDRRLLGDLAVPLALWALGSLFLLYLGFLHGGAGDPLVTATTRFSHGLPPDDPAPGVLRGLVLPARPQLGAAAVRRLAVQRPAAAAVGLFAARSAPSPGTRPACSTRCSPWSCSSCGSWPRGPSWSPLACARSGAAWRFVALLVSDVVIVHGFFVWPKLIAAAFVLAALAMVVSEDWRRRRSSVWAVCLFAALCALAMLAHGASAFALIPLLVYAAMRGLPSWRPLLVAVVVALALLAPWTAYQRWVDPPGDRLVKWQIGGSLAIDDRGAVETIVDSYQAVGWDGTVALKRANVTGMVHRPEAEAAVRAAVDMVEAGQVAGRGRDAATAAVLLAAAVPGPAAAGCGGDARRPRDAARSWSRLALCDTVAGPVLRHGRRLGTADVRHAGVSDHHPPGQPGPAAARDRRPGRRRVRRLPALRRRPDGRQRAVRAVPVCAGRQPTARFVVLGDGWPARRSRTRGVRLAGAASLSRPAWLLDGRPCRRARRRASGSAAPSLDLQAPSRPTSARSTNCSPTMRPAPATRYRAATMRLFDEAVVVLVFPSLLKRCGVCGPR